MRNLYDPKFFIIFKNVRHISTKNVSSDERKDQPTVPKKTPGSIQKGKIIEIPPATKTIAYIFQNFGQQKSNGNNIRFPTGSCTYIYRIEFRI